MIVLDTHVLLWWVTASAELPEKALGYIRRAKSKKAIHVSSISIWEIAMLVKSGRLVLSVPLAEWIRLVEELPFVRFIPVDNAIAEHSVNLPGDFHKDPADRIIVATSRILNMPVVTKDEKIVHYPHVRTIWNK